MLMISLFLYLLESLYGYWFGKDKKDFFFLEKEKRLGIWRGEVGK